MRITIDTNIVASAFYFGGKPRHLLSLVMEGKIDSIVSVQILDEYRRIIAELGETYKQKNNDISFEAFISRCKTVVPSQKISICRDPDDDKFIECALEGKCVYIVSGDKDLLSLEKVETVEIVTITEFFEKFEKA